ncbi:hypothetical protein JCM2811A_30460 [Methylorubrum rhodinum]
MIEAPERCSNPAKLLAGVMPAGGARPSEPAGGKTGGAGRQDRGQGADEAGDEAAKRRPAQAGEQGAQNDPSIIGKLLKVGLAERVAYRVATRLMTKVLPENWTCPGALMCSSIRRRLRPSRAESERVSYQ